MTYAQFLLVFLLLPILLLAVLLRRHVRRSHLAACGLVCLLAFVYTTPWDNYAAYKRLWTFDPAFVLGPPFWFGYLPLEEYLFYFGEAIFVCLVTLALSRVRALRPLPPAPSPRREGGVTESPRPGTGERRRPGQLRHSPFPPRGGGRGEG